MQISYLTEHPDFVPALAAALLEQWRWVTPELTLADRTAKVEEHLNWDKLPIAWVAHWEGQPIGTAALRVQDLEGREDLTPWLGGVWVAPTYRGRGIGAALCSVVEEKARVLGYDELFLFTLDKQVWYSALNWGSREPARWRGHPGTIMHKRLAA